MAERLELKSRIGALIALVVLFLFLGGLLFAVGATDRHPHPGLAAIGALIAIVPIVLVVLAARRRLTIDDRRIVAKGMFGTTAIPWDDVAHYNYWSLGQQGVYVAGGGGAGVLVVLAAMAIAKAVRKSPNNRLFSMGGMRIVAKDGQVIKLDLRYKGVATALDRCFDELHARLRDQPRDYAPFTVTASELTHAKKGTISLADIEKISGHRRPDLGQEARQAPRLGERHDATHEEHDAPHRRISPSAASSSTRRPTSSSRCRCSRSCAPRSRATRRCPPRRSSSANFFGRAGW